MSITLVADCRAVFPSIRDQGARPTCLACAMSDTHAAIRKTNHPWSAEYLFYYGVQRMPGRSPNDGLTVTAGTDALRDDGQPPETVWPYLQSVPSPILLWKPPVVSAVTHARPDPRPATMAAVRSALDARTPAVLAVAISRAFVHAGTDGSLPSLANDDFCGLHAIVAVGHGTTANGTATLIRNSWGPDWAANGHAWLLDTYLAPRLRSVTLLLPHP